MVVGVHEVREPVVATTTQVAVFIRGRRREQENPGIASITGAIIHMCRPRGSGSSWISPDFAAIASVDFAATHRSINSLVMLKIGSPISGYRVAVESKEP